jgi:hypothetical protein
MNTIKITDKAPEYKATSARALWFAAVSKCNGKTPEEFVEAATKTPPALKKDGKPEHPAGWLRYFVKEGIVALVPVEAAPAAEAEAPKAKKSKKK